MISSLANFLMLILYQGFNQRVAWILLMYTMGAVCVARIAIEQSRQYATGYLAALALAAFVVLARFMDGSMIFCAIILALIAYLSDRIVHDCTLIDESEDSSGQGLIEFGRDQLKGQQSKAASLSDKLPEETESDKELPAKEQSTDKEKLVAKSKGHQPGRTVMYLAIAALPLFGLGQFLLRSDSATWSSAQKYLALYLFSSLSLLVTTSFLGLRRYLRQRKIDMPGDVTVAWLAGGLVMIGAILSVAYLAPMPGQLLASIKMPEFLTAPKDLQSSSKGWGNEGANQSSPDSNSTDKDPNQKDKQTQGIKQQKGAPPGPTQSGEGKKGPTGQTKGGNKSGGKESGGKQDGQKKGAAKKEGGAKKDGGTKNEASQAKKNPTSKSNQQQKSSSEKQSEKSNANQKKGASKERQQNNAAKQNDAQGPKKAQSPNKAQSKDNAKEKGGQQENSEKSNEPPQKSDAQKSDAQQDDSNQRKDSPQDQKADPKQSSPDGKQIEDQQKSSDKSKQQSQESKQESSNASSASQPPPADKPSSSSSIGKLFSALGSFLRILVMAGLLVVVVAFVYLYRDAIAQWWSQLWNRDVSPVVAGAAPTETEQTKTPPIPFSAFRNPIGKEKDPRKIVVVTFQAFEAWTREQGWKRDENETPNEFIRRVAHSIPGFATPATQIVEAYNRIVYGRGKATRRDLTAAQEVWQSMRK